MASASTVGQLGCRLGSLPIVEAPTDSSVENGGSLYFPSDRDRSKTRNPGRRDRRRECSESHATCHRAIPWWKIDRARGHHSNDSNSRKSPSRDPVFSQKVPQSSDDDLDQEVQNSTPSVSDEEGANSSRQEESPIARSSISVSHVQSPINERVLSRTSQKERSVARVINLAEERIFRRKSRNSAVLRRRSKCIDVATKR